MKNLAIEIKFPDFGEGLHEGEIVEWVVKEGQSVEMLSELVLIQTDKMADHITAPGNGKVTSIKKKEGEVVKVGDVLLLFELEQVTTGKSRDDKPIQELDEAIQDEAEEDPSLFKPDSSISIKIGKTNKTSPTATQSSQKFYNKQVLAAPAVRRRARENGVDLKYLKGTKKNGRITQDDLTNYLQNEKSVNIVQDDSILKSESSKEIIKLQGIRKVIAKNMRKSKDFAAHFTYFDEVEMTEIDKLKKLLQKKTDVKITYIAIFMKLLVPALRKYRMINSKFIDEKQEIHVFNNINIGISVDTPQGLIVPVVKDVDMKSVYTIAQEVVNLAEKARNNSLSANNLSEGTFTITSIGNIGGMMATPIIKHPEVAILGLMQAKLRPVVREITGKSEIVIRKIMYLSFSLDHRVIDGALGARFISELIQYIENPGLLYFETGVESK